jgi:hypothetical protein
MTQPTSAATIDVRTIAHRERHPLIFHFFRGLGNADTMDTSSMATTRGPGSTDTGRGTRSHVHGSQGLYCRTCTLAIVSVQKIVNLRVHVTVSALAGLLAKTRLGRAV